RACWDGASVPSVRDLVDRPVPQQDDGAVVMGGGDSIEGRKDELSRIANFLDGVTDGGGSPSIPGGAGTGKTTLWRATLDLAAERGFQTISCRAAEADTRISYAGLADLLTPVVADVRERLPAPPRLSL